MGKLICVEGLVEEPTKIDIDFIAEFVHESCRQLAEMGGDDPIKTWLNCDEHQREVVIKGVVAVMENPDMTPQQCHEQWVRDKLEAGWTWGEVKDEARKEHPLLVSYDELSSFDKLKDVVFSDTVKMLMRQM